MNSKNTLSNTIKSILAVALLGTFAAGCSSKTQDASADQSKEPSTGMQEADTAIIGSDGSVTIIEDEDAMQEAVLEEALPEQATAEEAVREEALPAPEIAGGGSAEGSGSSESGSQTSGESESSESSTSGEESGQGSGTDEEEVPGGKDTGGF